MFTWISGENFFLTRHLKNVRLPVTVNKVKHIVYRHFPQKSKVVKRVSLSFIGTVYELYWADRGHYFSYHVIWFIWESKELWIIWCLSALSDLFCMEESFSYTCKLVTWSVCFFMLQGVTSFVSDNILLCHIVRQTWFWSSVGWSSWTWKRLLPEQLVDQLAFHQQLCEFTSHGRYIDCTVFVMYWTWPLD